MNYLPDHHLRFGVCSSSLRSQANFQEIVTLPLYCEPHGGGFSYVIVSVGIFLPRMGKCGYGNELADKFKRNPQLTLGLTHVIETCCMNEDLSPKAKRAWSTPKIEKLGVDETCTGTGMTVELMTLNQCPTNLFASKSRTFCTPT